MFAGITLEVPFHCMVLLLLPPVATDSDHLHLIHMTLFALFHSDRKHADLLLGFSEQLSISFTSLTLEYAVHLFKSGILRLRKAQPHPHYRASKKDAEEDVCAPMPCLQHGRNEESNGEVVEPI